MPLTRNKLPTHLRTDFKTPDSLVSDQNTVVTDLYDWHAKENPDYPLFVYHDGNGLEYITYATANRAINCVAHYIASKVGSGSTGSKLPVVALLANTDSITYFCTALGMMRAGCTAFLVSTRNGAAAVADMLQRTSTTDIVVSSDDAIQEVADDALKKLRASGTEIKKHAVPTFDDIFAESVDANSPFRVKVGFPSRLDVNATGVILHSSGSTGHPKPLLWSHKQVLRWTETCVRSGVNITGSIMGCHGTPFFHGLGLFLYSAAPLFGFIVAALRPSVPPTIPTPDAVWKGIVSTESNYSWSVPSFIEEWARDPEKVVQMKKMAGVIYGGAGLSEDVGNALASKGVSILQCYGCTEAGLINDVFIPGPGMDWAYWTVTKSTECVFQSAEDDLFELVILSPFDIPLPKSNTKVGDRDAYATSDLVAPHPTKSGLWKVVGRADDQIILVNGEKTNPLPLEKIINEDPHVKHSLIFGRGKFQNGVLIEPSEEYAFPPNDIKRLAEYRNMIWPTIQRANDYAPQHSRIFKEMIVVTAPSKPFQFTIKNLPRRNVIVKEYEEEIEALYKEVEESSKSDIAHPGVWNAESTLSFVRAVVEDTLHRSISDDADLFRNGGDSLQATWIRNTILGAIRETGDKAAANRIPSNIVFSAPTIASLAHAILRVMDTPNAVDSHSPEALWKYVEKYSAGLPSRPADLVDRPVGLDVVLITGTTGGFGCDTLAHLLLDESVRTVYAFNRKGARAMERQREQFRARGLDETLLDSPKFRMVESVLHEPDFGLEPELLDEVRRSVSHIMHNAWKVDFNMTIASFEVDMQGARNLVDLALSSPYTKPPSMIFVSSIGIFRDYNLAPPVPEAPLDDPKCPFGHGYAEAKWVTEHVLQNVSHQTNMHTIVMRLGQVAGDRTGYWNEKEWFPSLVKSALFQRCLPDIEGTVSWFPAYEAAKAFAEMRHSSEPFVHLVHPHPTSWYTIMVPIAEALDVPLVPYTEWLASLEKSVEPGTAAEVEAMKSNPALRLIPFYRAQTENMSSQREPMGLVFLSTQKAQKVSPSLGSMPVLDDARAGLWVAAWRKAGFL